MTERAAYVFKVTEYGDGKPWIMLENAGPALSIAAQGVLGLDVHEDITFQQAKELTDLLNNTIANVSYTDLRGK